LADTAELVYVGSISNLHVQVFICIFLSNATLLEGLACARMSPFVTHMCIP
jgi:hypothetical protein